MENSALVYEYVNDRRQQAIRLHTIGSNNADVHTLDRASEMLGQNILLMHLISGGNFEA